MLSRTFITFLAIFHAHMVFFSLFTFAGQVGILAASLHAKKPEKLLIADFFM